VTARLAGLLVGVLAATSASAASLDIRDCPLDTLVFVDPWANSTFEVDRVGRSETWSCPDGVKPPDMTCRGPFGDTVLQGTYAEYGGAEQVPMTAVYSVIAAVPCCGWNVAEGRTGDQVENFRWLDATEMPVLRSVPWLSIDSDPMTEHGSDFGNPLYAAACTLR
jgi:hypothetical protein